MHSFHRNGSDQLFNIVLPQGNDTYYNTYYTYILHIHTTHLVHAGDVPDILRSILYAQGKDNADSVCLHKTGVCT